MTDPRQRGKHLQWRRDHTLDIGFIPWNKKEMKADRHSLEDYTEITEDMVMEE